MDVSEFTVIYVLFSLAFFTFIKFDDVHWARADLFLFPSPFALDIHSMQLGSIMVRVLHQKVII